MHCLQAILECANQVDKHNVNGKQKRERKREKEREREREREREQKFEKKNKTIFLKKIDFLTKFKYH
jgi:hypothetical protein